MRDGGTSVAKFEWAKVPGPKYYRPSDVEPAIKSVEQTNVVGGDPGASLRSAVGNDHAGTLYPAAVPATGRLLEIIRDRPGAPRKAALDILLDWWGTFQPEPGYATFPGSSGVGVDLLGALTKLIVEAKPIIETIPSNDSVASKPALKLLRCIEAGWAPFDPRY
jgi:hypothetical protein